MFFETKAGYFATKLSQHHFALLTRSIYRDDQISTMTEAGFLTTQFTVR